MNISHISAEELNNEIKSNPNIILIDVRTPGEFNSAHIPGSKNYPLNSTAFKSFIDEFKNKEDTVYVTCQSGARSKNACAKLSEKNISIKNLDGGINSWKNSNLPVIEGKGAISMERQVRIAAGSLVLLGIILSFLVNTSFVYIAAFVGAGLVFSGITDTCGMARALSYMPWNKTSEDKEKCCIN